MNSTKVVCATIVLCFVVGICSRNNWSWNTLIEVVCSTIRFCCVVNETSINIRIGNMVFKINSTTVIGVTIFKNNILYVYFTGINIKYSGMTLCIQNSIVYTNDRNIFINFNMLLPIIFICSTQINNISRFCTVNCIWNTFECIAFNINILSQYFIFIWYCQNIGINWPIFIFF